MTSERRVQAMSRTSISRQQRRGPREHRRYGECWVLRIGALAAATQVACARQSAQDMVDRYSTEDYHNPDSAWYREQMFWSLALVTCAAGLISVIVAFVACRRSWRDKAPWLSELWPWLVSIAAGFAVMCAAGALVTIFYFVDYYGEFEGSIGRIEDSGNEIGAWGSALNYAATTQALAISSAVASALEIGTYLNVTVTGADNTTRCAEAAVSYSITRADLVAVRSAAAAIAAGSGSSMLAADAQAINDRTDDVSRDMGIRLGVDVYFVIPIVIAVVIVSAAWVVFKRGGCYPLQDLENRPDVHLSALRVWAAIGAVTIVAMWPIAVDLHLCTIHNANACRNFTHTLEVVIGHPIETGGVMYYRGCAAAARAAASNSINGSCTDVPNWEDAEGYSCRAYRTGQWCTTDGTEGPNWQYPAWGNLSDYFSPTTGVLVTDACCACGGGANVSALDAAYASLPNTPNELVVMSNMENLMIQLRGNLTEKTFNCTQAYSARYNASVSEYRAALNAIDRGVAAMRAATSCNTSIADSLARLEDATCGNDGMVVGLGVYFETACGLVVALTLSYLAWSIIPVAGANKVKVTSKTGPDDRLGGNNNTLHLNYLQSITSNRTWSPPASRAGSVNGGEYLDAEVMYREMDWSRDPVQMGSLEFHR